ncbi:TrmB family transcriptional regulator [Paenibacillus massiliensis]|uniref:TrmB family transcriptional regulator n=1 Tax=Paenibacillus massiliensis TaxID=225917 RepID=UPI000414F318|nr:TrmB family transcriptional regulator [Paenibacillus massiliensis]
MERLLHHLRNLGFTEMEGKTMLDLARYGASSGYEVAKRLGASRSNVYAALQRLASHGYLRTSEGEPVRYSVLPAEELTRIISGQVQESLEAVVEEMPRPEPDKSPFYNMEGDRNIIDTVLRELRRSQHEVIADVSREEAELLREELAQAEERGVKLLWSYDGGEAPSVRLLPLDTFGEMTPMTGRAFSLIIDRRWCILGTRDGEGQAQAVVTEHPVMTRLLLNHFAQEVILFELEHDMGTELSARYGPGFRSIVDKYTR